MTEGAYQNPFFARARAGIYTAALALVLVAAVLVPLLAFGAGGADLSELVGRLRGHDLKAREAASKAVMSAGPEAVPALLAEIAKDPSFGRVAYALIRDMKGRAVPAVLERLSDPELGGVAASALPYAAPNDTGEYAEEFLACLRSKPAARTACGMALLKTVGPKAKKRVGLLTEALKDADPVVRVHAATALGRIGAKAKAALTALDAAAVGDADAQVRQQSAEAAKKVRGS